MLDFYENCPFSYIQDISLDSNHKLKNVSDRSINLAPFNTTRTENSFNQALNFEIVNDAPLQERQILQFSDQVREANRQYEFNYNSEVDNGIMFSINSKTEIPRSDSPQLKTVKKVDSNKVLEPPQVS